MQHHIHAFNLTHENESMVMLTPCSVQTDRESISSPTNVKHPTTRLESRAYILDQKTLVWPDTETSWIQTLYNTPYTAHNIVIEDNTANKLPSLFFSFFHLFSSSYVLPWMN